MRPDQQQRGGQQPSTRGGKSTIRIERPSENLEMGSGDDANWAISYSDLLMVLMSFFVIFFQFNHTKTAGLIQQIAMDMGAKPLAKDGDKNALPGGVPGAKGTGGTGGLSLTETLAQGLATADLQVKVERSKDSLVVNLPDDIFAPRAFALDDPTKTLLAKLFEKVRPFQDQVDLYFIGHTDPKPLSRSNAYLRDNFTLSTLRATAALQAALEAGFPKEHLFAQGGAENTRSSRTLSVKVRLRGQDD